MAATPETPTILEASSQATSADGTKIGFTKSGTGPALILVDGALCYREFGPSRAIAKLLESNFTVYIYDRRGRGESTDTHPYAVEREVEDLDAVLQEAGGTASVFGQSSGAALLLDAANRLKGIQKIATYEAPFIVDGTTQPRDHDLVVRMEALTAAGDRGGAVKLFMKTVGAPAFAVWIMQLSPAWSKLKSVAHTLPYDLHIIEDYGYGKALPQNQWPKVTMPAMVMDGGKSPQWMRNAQRAISENLAGAEYRTLEGQTHMLKPEAIAPALVEFFS